MEATTNMSHANNPYRKLLQQTFKELQQYLIFGSNSFDIGYEDGYEGRPFNDSYVFNKEVYSKGFNIGRDARRRIKEHAKGVVTKLVGN